VSIKAQQETHPSRAPKFGNCFAFWKFVLQKFFAREILWLNMGLFLSPL
jgi:hypothetical protein